jgi:hypothetical protein
MLEDAGIPAYPVVMSTRNRGRLPLAHPTLQMLNTFVVGAAISDTTLVYIDGSVVDGYINELPAVLAVERARLLIPNQQGRWVDLQAATKTSLRSVVEATLLPDGTISGIRKTNYNGRYASSVRSKFRKAKDSLDYIRSFAEREKIQVKALRQKGRSSFTPSIEEELAFVKHPSKGNNLVYIHPLLFLHISETPFKQSTRYLPVEFNGTDQVTLSVTLTLPEGYTVDELPEDKLLSACNRGLSMRYSCRQLKNTVVTQYQFKLNRALFMPEHYSALQQFFEQMATKNKELMVLKKL